MGTPEFAVPSLQILLENGYEIPAVITAPDKPSGRGQKINYSAVKEFVLNYNIQNSYMNQNFNPIEILQPEKLKNPDFLNLLRSIKADLQIVVAFRMLPELVWSMPNLGTFNLHASLLPQYRGAAPINWAIINGETISGITTFYLNEEIDKGKSILQEQIPIGVEETAGEYHDRLKDAGANLVLKTVQLIQRKILNIDFNFDLSNIDSTITQLEELVIGNQPKTGPSLTPTFLHYAPKLEKNTGLIDWSKSTDSIFNLIRGLSPFPSAFTYLSGQTLKIYKARPVTEAHKQVEGTIYTDGKTQLQYFTKDGYLEIHDLQLENKKRMKTGELLRGLRLEPGFYLDKGED